MFADLPNISKLTPTEIAQEVFSHLQIVVSDFDNDFSKMPPQVFMYTQRNDDFTLWNMQGVSDEIKNAPADKWKHIVTSAFTEWRTDGCVLFVSLAEQGFLAFIVRTKDNVTFVSLDLNDYSFFEVYSRKL